jgi:hypothetical protein
MSRADMRCPGTESNRRHGDFQSGEDSRIGRAKCLISRLRELYVGRLANRGLPEIPSPPASDDDVLAYVRSVALPEQRR